MKLTKKHARAVLGNAAVFGASHGSPTRDSAWSEHGKLTVARLPPEAAQLPDNWRHVLRATTAQASQDWTRPHVAHALLDGKHAVATDGHRLCSLPCEVALPGELLLTAAIGWAEVEGRGPAFIGMRDGRPFLWVAPYASAQQDGPVWGGGGWLVEAATPVDGRKLNEKETALGPKDFPNWRRATPNRAGLYHVAIDASMVEAWCSALGDVCAARGFGAPGVQITSEWGEAGFHAKLIEVALPSSRWSMRTCMLPWTQRESDRVLDVGVCAPYLAEAIRAVDDDSGIQLWLGGPLDPIIVEPQSAGVAWRRDDNAVPFCIVAPMRV